MSCELNTSADSEHWTLDTDILIHQRGVDAKIRSAAQGLLVTKKPTAISAFSMVELKGNFIQDLILLRHKVSDSDDLREAYSRIARSGGRKQQLMLVQLIDWLGGTNFAPNPWAPARAQLLTHLDAQILASWSSFAGIVDKILDDFQCTRAREPPMASGNAWNATIPRCTKANTSCSIEAFMARHLDALKKLSAALATLPVADVTNELDKIRTIVDETIASGRFPWQGTRCRGVGDLLVSLQSKSTHGLVSSNRKEQVVLSKALEYDWHFFDSVAIRSG